MKLLLCMFALLTFAAPMRAQPNDTAPAPTTANRTLEPVTIDNGWTITPVLMPEDNAAAMLGMRFWRFTIESPTGSIEGDLQLELRRPGQTPIRMIENSFEMGYPKVELTFGLMPIDGDLLKADELKTFTSFRSERGALHDLVENASTQNCANALKEIDTRTSLLGYKGLGAVEPDGSLVLRKFLIGKTPDDGLNSLVLVVKAAPKAQQN